MRDGPRPKVDTADELNVMAACLEFVEQGEVRIEITSGADADQMNGRHSQRSVDCRHSLS